MEKALLIKSSIDMTAYEKNFTKHFAQITSENINAPNIPSGKEFVINKKYLYEFEQALKQQKYLFAQYLIHKLVETIKQFEKANGDYIRNVFYRIVFILGKTAEIHNISISSRSDTLIASIAHVTTLDEIEREILCAILDLSDFILFNEKTSPAPIDMLNNYIDEHYSDIDITIGSIAEALKFTDTYLCILHKKKTNKTIHQKITEMRMEKAKKLLKSTRHRLCFIAKKVGYTDCRCFVASFLKYVGMSPKKYRESFASE